MFEEDKISNLKRFLLTHPLLSKLTFASFLFLSTIGLLKQLDGGFEYLAHLLNIKSETPYKVNKWKTIYLFEYNYKFEVPENWLEGASSTVRESSYYSDEDLDVHLYAWMYYWLEDDLWREDNPDYREFKDALLTQSPNLREIQILGLVPTTANGDLKGIIRLKDKGTGLYRERLSENGAKWLRRITYYSSDGDYAIECGTPIALKEKYENVCSEILKRFSYIYETEY